MEARCDATNQLPEDQNSIQTNKPLTELFSSLEGKVKSFFKEETDFLSSFTKEKIYILIECMDEILDFIKDLEIFATKYPTETIEDTEKRSNAISWLAKAYGFSGHSLSLLLNLSENKIEIKNKQEIYNKTIQACENSLKIARFFLGKPKRQQQVDLETEVYTFAAIAHLIYHHHKNVLENLNDDHVKNDWKKINDLLKDLENFVLATKQPILHEQGLISLGTTYSQQFLKAEPMDLQMALTKAKEFFLSPDIKDVGLLHLAQANMLSINMCSWGRAMTARAVRNEMVTQTGKVVEKKNYLLRKKGQQTEVQKKMQDELAFEIVKNKFYGNKKSLCSYIASINKYLIENNFKENIKKVLEYADIMLTKKGDHYFYKIFLQNNELAKKILEIYHYSISDIIDLCSAALKQYDINAILRNGTEQEIEEIESLVTCEKEHYDFLDLVNKKIHDLTRNITSLSFKPIYEELESKTKSSSDFLEVLKFFKKDRENRDQIVSSEIARIKITIALIDKRKKKIKEQKEIREQKYKIYLEKLSEQVQLKDRFLRLKKQSFIKNKADRRKSDDSLNKNNQQDKLRKINELSLLDKPTMIAKKKILFGDFQDALDIYQKIDTPSPLAKLRLLMLEAECYNAWSRWEKMRADYSAAEIKFNQVIFIYQKAKKTAIEFMKKLNDEDDAYLDFYLLLDFINEEIQIAENRNHEKLNMGKQARWREHESCPTSREKKFVKKESQKKSPQKVFISQPEPKNGQTKLTVIENITAPKIKKVDIPISKVAQYVIKKLKAAGYSGFAVGGVPRDFQVNKNPKDTEIATNAHPNEIELLFSGYCKVIGERFPIVLFTLDNETIEIVTLRGKADKNSPKTKVALSKGSQTTFIGTGSPALDATNRDLTINAFYYDIDSKEIRDYMGGFEDLEKKLIRMIGETDERIQEDPLRMLRALRFAAKLTFDLHGDIKEAIPKYAHLIQTLNSSRLLSEVGKLFLLGYGVESYKLLHKYCLLEQIFPVSIHLFSVNSTRFYQDLIEATLRYADYCFAENQGFDSAILFSAFLYSHWQKELIYVMPMQIDREEKFNLAAKNVLNKQMKILNLPDEIIDKVKLIWKSHEKCLIDQMDIEINNNIHWAEFYMINTFSSLVKQTTQSIKMKTNASTFFKGNQEAIQNVMKKIQKLCHQTFKEKGHYQLMMRGDCEVVIQLTKEKTQRFIEEVSFLMNLKMELIVLFPTQNIMNLTENELSIKTISQEQSFSLMKLLQTSLLIEEPSLVSALKCERYL